MPYEWQGQERVEIGEDDEQLSPAARAALERYDRDEDALREQQAGCD